MGIVGVFNGVTDPVLVGGMSRIVEENEQGNNTSGSARLYSRQ